MIRVVVLCIQLISMDSSGNRATSGARAPDSEAISRQRCRNLAVHRSKVGQQYRSEGTRIDKRERAEIRSGRVNLLPAACIGVWAQQQVHHQNAIPPARLRPPYASPLPSGPRGALEGERWALDGAAAQYEICDFPRCTFANELEQRIGPHAGDALLAGC